MSTDAGLPSAKIHQFSRKAVKNSADLRRGPDQRQIPVTHTEFGSAWYHEAAVNAERGRRPSIAQ